MLIDGVEGTLIKNAGNVIIFGGRGLGARFDDVDISHLASCFNNDLDQDCARF